MNYHGPYTLTRLLEPVLIASKPSRIVNVASVEHRIGYVTDIKKFMFDAKQFLYSGTKLGNVLFTYEHQRRLGALGVQVGCWMCCVRPPPCPALVSAGFTVSFYWLLLAATGCSSALICTFAPGSLEALVHARCGGQGVQQQYRLECHLWQLHFMLADLS